MPPAMKRLLADLQLPANRFDRRALVEVHLRLAQLRNDLLRRVSLPFHRVLPPSRAVRLSYQLVHLEGVRSRLRWTRNVWQSEPVTIGISLGTRRRSETNIRAIPSTARRGERPTVSSCGTTGRADTEF